MRKLLVDADSHNGFPNLALMKLSAYYKEQGYDVDLIKGIPTTAPLFDYEKVIISVIFSQNKERVLDYASQFDNEKVVIGGSGYDYTPRLTDYVEHIMPDYSLYDIDYSLGFTSRGCIRNCPFCVVPEKEGPLRDHAPITEFHHPDHKKVILLDNNFQASPRWRENLDYILEHDLKVNINQGLDIRLIDTEFAQTIREVKYYNWTFKHRGLHLAFDTMEVEKPVVKGIETLTSVGIRPEHLMIYVLVGYNTTFEQDLYRVNLLKELGVKPYIQLYNMTQDLQLRRLARWVNRNYYQFISWEAFD